MEEEESREKRMKNTDYFSCILNDGSIYNGNGSIKMVFLKGLTKTLEETEVSTICS